MFLKEIEGQRDFLSNISKITRKVNHTTNCKFYDMRANVSLSQGVVVKAILTIICNVVLLRDTKFPRVRNGAHR